MLHTQVFRIDNIQNSRGSLTHMARVVIHTKTGPHKIDKDDFDPEKENIAICQCGLSAEYPFCDGSHRRIDSEVDEVLYDYLYLDGDAADRHTVEIARTEETDT